jgi:hypothetical protein
MGRRQARRMKTIAAGALTLAMLAAPMSAVAQSSDTELAHKLANPIADLISLPFQYNYDCCFGPQDAARQTLNLQPVMPVPISPHYSVIIRTIVPIIYQDAPAAGLNDASGFGDVLQSFFFSPKHEGQGWMWGVGPAFSWPTASDDLGSDKWGAGPTALVVHAHGGTTYGVLANHIWSYAGGDNRDDVNQTFVQPFFSHTWPDTTAIVVNSETTYNWETEEWTAPLNVGVTHLYKFGDQRVQLGAFARGYLASEDDGPDWGLRLVATLLFPRT